MSIKFITAVAALVLGSTLHAAALEGYDGDNNRVPAASTAIPASAYASVHKSASSSLNGNVQTGSLQIGETKAGSPNAVYWRGRYLGTDPDANVRLRILREAIGG
jgi:hypothetical protein